MKNHYNPMIKKSWFFGNPFITIWKKKISKESNIIILYFYLRFYNIQWKCGKNITNLHIIGFKIVLLWKIHNDTSVHSYLHIKCFKFHISMFTLIFFSLFRFWSALLPFFFINVLFFFVFFFIDFYIKHILIHHEQTDEKKT